MDFQDRFKDRSSLLTKTGLLTILNAPGIPIPKTNPINISPFFIPASHSQFLPNNIHNKKPLPSTSSQHISNNSGLSFVSKSSYYRQSPLEVQSNRVSPQNAFLSTRRTSIVRTPSTRESSRGLRTRRHINDSSYAKVLEGDNTSFMLDNKYVKNKNRSVEAVAHNNEVDFIREFRYLVPGEREKSKDGKENNKDYNIIKNAIESVERFQLRGASRDIMNNEREVVPSHEKSNIRIRAPLIPNISHERKPLGNILPQLEKVENLNMGSVKPVLLSFRERESQAAAHLKQYTQRNNNVNTEERKPLKAKSVEKLLVLKDRDQLESFKVEYMKKEEDKKMERSITGGRLRIPLTEREKGIVADTERMMKKVSFKEDSEILKVRCNSRHKQNRRLKLNDQILERILNKENVKKDEKDKENFF